MRCSRCLSFNSESRPICQLRLSRMSSVTPFFIGRMCSTRQNVHHRRKQTKHQRVSLLELPPKDSHKTKHLMYHTCRNQDPQHNNITMRCLSQLSNSKYRKGKPIRMQSLQTYTVPESRTRRTISPDKEVEHRVCPRELTDKFPEVILSVLSLTLLIHDKQRHSRIITSSSRRQGDRKSWKKRKGRKKGSNGKKPRGRGCSTDRLSR